MAEQVLVCDFSMRSGVTFALAEVGRRPAPATTDMELIGLATLFD